MSMPACRTVTMCTGFDDPIALVESVAETGTSVSCYFLYLKLHYPSLVIDYRTLLPGILGVLFATIKRLTAVLYWPFYRTLAVLC